MLKELDSLEKKGSFNIETIDADYKGSFFSNFNENEPLDFIEGLDEDDTAAIL